MVFDTLQPYNISRWYIQLLLCKSFFKFGVSVLVLVVHTPTRTVLYRLQVALVARRKSFCAPLLVLGVVLVLVRTVILQWYSYVLLIPTKKSKYKRV